jgi:hypothetical protein
MHFLAELSIALRAPPNTCLRLLSTSGAKKATEKSVSVRWDSDQEVLRGPYYTGELATDGEFNASYAEFSLKDAESPFFSLSPAAVAETCRTELLSSSPVCRGRGQ